MLLLLLCDQDAPADGDEADSTSGAIHEAAATSNETDEVHTGRALASGDSLEDDFADKDDEAEVSRSAEDSEDSKPAKRKSEKASKSSEKKKPKKVKF